jgi:hypothetical protein
MVHSGEQRAAIDRMIEDLRSEMKSPDANVGRAVKQNATDMSSLLKGATVYPPQGVFQGLLLNISA